MQEDTRQPPIKQETLQLISPKDLLRLPGKKALEVVLESPRPVTLVQSLAEEDLFWLVQEIGPEDALPILSLASNDQWQHLLDLEVWTKDRLDIDSATRWLHLLLKADPERFLIWGLREQSELIELQLSKQVQVRIREEDESPSEFDEGFFSFDGIFYIRINDDRYEQTIREFIERLAEYDLDRFRQLLLELAGVLPAELEEGLYRLKRVRLAEKGFLPFEEAVGIYQYLDPNSLFEREPQHSKTATEHPVSVSTSLLMQTQNLFYVSLKRIEDSRILQQLQIEFAGMCNQIICADSLVVRNKEHLADVVRKACGYVSIGLEEVTGGDPQKAARLLQKFSLQHIFRVGYGTALKLRWKTEKWLRRSWFVKQTFALSFWGDSWEGMLKGLLRKRPLFCTSISEGEPYREFRNWEEIMRCHTALDQITALDHLLSLLFAQTAISHPVPAYQPLTYKNLLLTCWARHYLHLPEETTPLELDELRILFRDLWAKETMPYRVEPRMKQAFVDWLQTRSDEAIDETLRHVNKTLERLFGEVEKEYGAVSLKDLDPRYMKHFLVALGA